MLRPARLSSFSTLRTARRSLGDRALNTTAPSGERQRKWLFLVSSILQPAASAWRAKVRNTLGTPLIIRLPCHKGVRHRLVGRGTDQK